MNLDPVNCIECGRKMPAEASQKDADGWLRIGLDGPSYLYCPDCRKRSNALRVMGAVR